MVRLFTLACSLSLVVGCATPLDIAAKMHMAKAHKFKAASMWEPTTERPGFGWIRQARDHPTRFREDMDAIGSYPMGIYLLGWFGDIWDLHTVAPLLASDDNDMRRVALAAFSRLSGVFFVDAATAQSWWEENRDSIPSAKPGERKR